MVIRPQFTDHSLNALAQILLPKACRGFILRFHLNELLYMLLAGGQIIPHAHHPFADNEKGPPVGSPMDPGNRYSAFPVMMKVTYRFWSVRMKSTSSK